MVGPLSCPIKAAGQPWPLVQHGPRAPGPGSCNAVLSSPSLPNCLHPAFCNHPSFFTNFYWSIVALQCCVSCTCMAKWGFPHSSVHKESACSAGDLGPIPGSGRAPGERNGNPLQYPCLENPIDRGAWWAAVDGVAKSRAQLSNEHTAKSISYTYTRVPSFIRCPSQLVWAIFQRPLCKYGLPPLPSSQAQLSLVCGPNLFLSHPSHLLSSCLCFYSSPLSSTLPPAWRAWGRQSLLCPAPQHCDSHTGLGGTPASLGYRLWLRGHHGLCSTQQSRGHCINVHLMSEVLEDRHSPVMCSLKGERNYIALLENCAESTWLPNEV